MKKQEPLTAVLVDDEKNANSLMQKLLAKHTPHVEVVAEATSVKEALDVLGRLTPDLLLLDIELYDGTGFDILTQVDYRSIRVIFVTAFNNYAVKAFRFSAIDYLLKPVVAEELAAAIQKAALPGKEEDSDEIWEAGQNYESLKNQSSRIALSGLKGYNFVDVCSIVRCETGARYTVCFMADGEQIIVSKSISDFEELLEDKGFVRVHTSHLVNIDYIKNYRIGRGGHITMKDGTLIPVAQRRKEHMLRRFNKI